MSTTETITGTITGGTFTATIPTPAAGATGPAGPVGVSPSAASVAAALAATPSFVAAVAAAMSAPATTPVATPTPTPVATPTGSSPITLPVYTNGVFHWAGDWSGYTVNYAFADKGVNGPGPVIQLPSTSQWQFWLPYPPNNPAGPAANGINFNLTGATHFTIAIKPSQAGAQATMGFYSGSGTADDVPYGNSLTITQAKYGPAAPVVGQWNVYTIPLADFAVSGWIYKFIIQQQGTTPQTWEIDQVGFY
jgi:hypothetical protein